MIGNEFSDLMEMNNVWRFEVLDVFKGEMVCVKDLQSGLCCRLSPQFGGPGFTTNV
jgi:hypothetical protein